MRPPVSAVCGRGGDARAELVGFANYRALPPGLVGHPSGLEWFCARHLRAAQTLTHLDSGAAIELLRKRKPWTGLLRRFHGWR